MYLETRGFSFSSQFFWGLIFFCIVHVHVFLFPWSEMVCGRVMYRFDVLECGMCCVRLASFAYHANLHLHVIESVIVLSKNPTLRKLVLAYTTLANACACLHCARSAVVCSFRGSAFMLASERE